MTDTPESVDDLLKPLGGRTRPIDERRPSSAVDDRALASLVTFAEAAVLPYWSDVQGRLERFRETRGRVIATNGIGSLLNSLHPRIRWNSSVLEVHGLPDRDVTLDGRGLMLSPSFFLPRLECVFIEHWWEEKSSVVAFPINVSGQVDLRETRSFGTDILGALVGHTRAAALLALTEGRSTGELAKQLGLSMAGASKHASILRKSGLITTLRNRNTALHALTPLGFALLRSSQTLMDSEATDMNCNRRA
ncbi:winged helix-turn-helix domain-containing protein [Streptomyces sp. ACA25]|uniref:ArsR/SmtB family transcription factor n=1 Tax=Streptomyces sp. ACA25 TaxID=3022596 RepID=UPI002307F209|nr:winged helix-turn-helix domain-containing protein [Streptomyces sp. ACA25]MDB1088327.1 winged helix-turn-helix domain-containing protein [Streptomyces sp. ACA25]